MNLISDIWNDNTNLYVARQWKVFPQGMTFKAIIGQDSSEVGMVGEVDSEHVENFAFVPIGTLENVANWIQRRQLVSISLDSDPRVEAKREQIVNHFKSVLPGRHVNTSNVDQVGELSVVMVLQEGDDWQDTFRSNQDLQLVPSSQLNLW